MTKKKERGHVANMGPLTRSPTGTKPGQIPKGWCYICKAEHLYDQPHIK